MDEKEFRELKKKELQKLYFELGTGLFDSQTLEYDIRFLIYILTDLGIIDIDPIKAEEISNGIVTPWATIHQRSSGMMHQ